MYYGRKVAVLLLLILSCFLQRTFTQRATVFSDANLVDVEKGRVMPHMDVTVQGPVITRIERHSKTHNAEGLIVIPATGKYLIPGLIDAHTHIIFKDVLVNYLKYGVTTV